MVPAIAYYEALRELELRAATAQIKRLKAFCLHPDRFMPLTTRHLETAAQLWATARKSGTPTADPHSLDADVILAAQALSLGQRSSDYIIATTNPANIAQFASCELWTKIKP
jgi:predicted nucleic acid-binding protein